MPNHSKATVALDALGGDGGLPVNLAAAKHALKIDRGLAIVACGPLAPIEAARTNWPESLRERLLVHDVTAGLAADAGPAEALRRGRESTVGEALRLVAEGEAEAAVSGGSTGALMVLARHLLGTWPGVDR